MNAMNAMTFTHEGQQFRIGFRHERSRDWSAHYGHAICFQPDSRGKYSLYCIPCLCVISAIGPAATRALKAAGREAEWELGELASGMNATVLLKLQKRAKAVRRLTARDLARDVTCTIYARVKDEWIAAMVGRSRLNTDAGDRYSREDGRIAALRSALPKPGPVGGAGSGWVASAPNEAQRREFAKSAMDAYRARKATSGTRKAGGK